MNLLFEEIVREIIEEAAASPGGKKVGPALQDLIRKKNDRDCAAAGRAELPNL
jgi:hypothetical protein